MSRVNLIKYIVIHCSAGFSLIPAIENFWYRPKKQGGLGWKNPGYHVIIYRDGTVWYVTKDGSYSKDIEDWYPEKVTNGVAGFNTECIHICYIGGIENIGTNSKPVWKAKDTRNDRQKGGILDSIRESFLWLQSKGINTENGIIVLGHRDFSEDKNNNNIIESWERIKECPSFDALNEYKWITVTRDQSYILPRNRK